MYDVSGVITSEARLEYVLGLPILSYCNGAASLAVQGGVLAVGCPEDSTIKDYAGRV